MLDKDLNQYAKDIYNANKIKGFHDIKHTEKHLLCLIVSELMEAVEADRQGRVADLNTFDKCLEIVSDDDYNIQYQKLFHVFIKDTIQDEFADAVIKLLDMSGAKSYKIESNLGAISFNENDNLTEKIWSIINSLMDKNINVAVSRSLFSIIELSKSLNIDIFRHIELKLKFNEMRVYKHGKKY